MILEVKILEIIARVLKAPKEKINVNSGLYRFDGWDSLAHTNIVLELENELDIAFDFDELDKITTVAAIITSVKNKI